MWSTIKLFLGLRPRAWVEIAGLVGLMLLITATYVGQGLMIADLLFKAFSSGDIGGLLASLAVIGVLQLARIGLIVVRDWWAPRVSARVKEAVREGLTLKLMEIGPGQAQRMRTGDLQSTLVDSVELLDPLVGRFVPSVVASVLGSCLASVYVIAVDPLVGLVVLACALLAPLSKLFGNRRSGNVAGAGWCPTAACTPRAWTRCREWGHSRRSTPADGAAARSSSGARRSAGTPSG
ncbi:ABC transporter transmembrane domain-containing protein [Amycolatopsis sp. EV170708-02-1]|uniref:ABC transporter transmembrane domain-containing protein n=1 Tax=Amycolatopsis sp. EV170708-02-1 TaxID=2919322 RepID=UPI001F0C8BAD|nr:ABC transporter transmembrane domain-containing protein [Amycolatopsis sp. EV170708-02-1]UMP03403.1 hypothetical protein MJQ72_00505 [Amycolatopsis sp. EV170708-02-1]